MATKVLIFLLAAALLFSSFFFAHAYLPGVSPGIYSNGTIIPLKVNSITSSHTQLPYPYYSLPTCQPKTIEDSVENLGEILTGDRIESSPYDIITGVDIDCKILCEQELTQDRAKFLIQRINEEYRVNWILDNLPSATKKQISDGTGTSKFMYEPGFQLGVKGKNIPGADAAAVYLNNHVDIHVEYNLDEQGFYRIVAFEVTPVSINYDLDKMECGVSNNRQYFPVKLDTTKIRYTYSVTWKENTEIKYSSRWDVYLLMTDDQIHWFSIINSLMIVLFLTGMVAMIMLRTLNADLRKYRELDTQEDAQEETGWKLVHGDVFRPPAFSMLLSVLVGTGIQILGMTLVTMVFAVLGFLSPANRGALMNALIVLFVVMGIFAGYFSARLYKLFKGQDWKKNMLLTAFLFPGTVFAIFMLINLVLAYLKSSGAVPFGTLVALMALWFGISVPLVFFGSYFGFKKPVEEIKVRTNQIPRQIPEQVWYMRPLFSILMGGILPFGAVFIELFFILSSIWLHQFYYIFGFLAIVFLILIITCAEITIVMCYFQLCSEDYHWWWRSFLTSGASAFYMLLYSIFYFFTKLQLTKFASILLYFGYTFIMALAFFVMTGSIGFYACFIFVKKIYSSIRSE
jgi:transmembrane 9 superfamily protein 2/4